MLKPLTAIAMLALSFSQARAAGYQIMPIGEPGKYVGCMAINEQTELGFVAVQQSLGVLMNSKLLRVRQGDAVDGTWRVDEGREMKLDAVSTTADTVTGDLPQSREAFAQLANGNAVTVTLGATTVEWSLEGSKQALADIGACMDKNVPH